MRSASLYLLREMPIFGGVEETALQFIMNHAQILSKPKGELFFKEGDLASAMYVLEAGAVEVFRTWKGKDYTLNFLNPGDCLGEMSLMGFRPRSASARALQDCKVIEITTNLLSELLNVHPRQFMLIQMNMGREVCRRLVDADKRIFICKIERDIDIDQQAS
jgi:CRP-like cAMP-binding protein